MDDGKPPATNGTDAVIDSGPAEAPAEKPVTARKDPVIVGAGRARSLSGGPQQGERRLDERRAQRSLSLRLREEIQEVPRGARLSCPFS